MKYKFATIENFSDVEPYIDINFFYVAEKDGYKIVNYRINSAEAFPPVVDYGTAVRREFRGITFCSKTGKLIRRPYNKFFNINELEETRLENINLNSPHVIMEKLDGSMIACFKVDDRIIYGTKLGDTEIGKQAEEFVKNSPRRKNYETFIEECLRIDNTPIFEWCSNKNRIVLDYPIDRLVLTAIRDNKTGEYVSLADMYEIGYAHGVEVVEAYPASRTLSQGFIDQLRQQEGLEGVVARFHNGHMVKIKADHYCQLHRVKSDINVERNLVDLLVNEKLDDVMGILPQEDQNRIKNFQSQLIKKLDEAVFAAISAKNQVISQGLSRKDFALSSEPHPYVKSLIFKHFNDITALKVEDMFRFFIDFVSKNCNNGRNYESLKSDQGILNGLPDWKSLMFTGE